MADYYFARAESWEELVAAHDGWVESYNTQKHWAHRERKDARRSPAEVLGFLTGVRQRPEDLRRAFFSTRFTRVLDASGYARLKHWRIYAEEGLARSEVALWLGAEGLAVEFAGDTLARYDADYSARSNRLREVKSPQLFETVHRRTPAQPRLFELVVLGNTGWLKALTKEEYAPRKLRRPQALQQALFSYIEAVWQRTRRAFSQSGLHRGVNDLLVRFPRRGGPRNLAHGRRGRRHPDPPRGARPPHRPVQGRRPPLHTAR